VKEQIVFHLPVALAATKRLIILTKGQADSWDDDDDDEDSRDDGDDEVSVS